VHVKRLAWIGLALVVVAAVVVLVVRSRPGNSPASRADRIEHDLACPVCEGQSIADSDAPESRAIRAEIPQQIAAGRTDAEIRDFILARYPNIQLAPASSGIGLVAWLVPVLAFLLAASGLAYALWRWSHTPRLAATAEDEAIVAAARENKA
jgi:cytochrome c-type biogenesis protein CcmH